MKRSHTVTDTGLNLSRNCSSCHPETMSGVPFHRASEWVNRTEDFIFAEWLQYLQNILSCNVFTLNRSDLQHYWLHSSCCRPLKLPEIRPNFLLVTFCVHLQSNIASALAWRKEIWFFLNSHKRPKLWTHQSTKSSSWWLTYCEVGWCLALARPF